MYEVTASPADHHTAPALSSLCILHTKNVGCRSAIDAEERSGLVCGRGRQRSGSRWQQWRQSHPEQQFCGDAQPGRHRLWRAGRWPAGGCGLSEVPVLLLLLLLLLLLGLEVAQLELRKLCKKRPLRTCYRCDRTPRIA